jgi:hypothetical protein
MSAVLDANGLGKRYGHRWARSACTRRPEYSRVGSAQLALTVAVEKRPDQREPYRQAAHARRANRRTDL